MESVSMTERYALLYIGAVGSHTDDMASQYTAGIVLGGFCELLENGFVLEKDGAGLYAVKKPEHPILAYLYENVRRTPAKSIQRWLDFYCCSPTYKNIRPLIWRLTEILEKKGYLRAEQKRGIFKKKIKFVLNGKAESVLNGYRQAVQSGAEDESTVFCTQMLLLADLFKTYFTQRQKATIKPVIRKYQNLEIWRKLEPYVAAIQNFNYQNAANTGVM